ncbi:MAG: hypothetical protein CMO42_03255 [Verrucomicrobiales bacterium]|mgnify:CR=1 FL=1|nr:hypothetical protein [Verrucomicrobiales bacterium]
MSFNYMTITKEQVQKFHRERINHKKEQNLLLSKIQKESDLDTKKTLLKEYIQINQKALQEYQEIINQS